MLSADDATISMQNLNKTELDGRMISVERVCTFWSEVSARYIDSFWINIKFVVNKQAKDDGTGPARPKVVKKELEKKKSAELSDEKKADDKKKAAGAKVNDDVKADDKKGI